jgi:hypothetical protein
MAGAAPIGLQRVAGVVSNSQLLNLLGNPVTLVPAPGAGLILRPQRVTLWCVLGPNATGLTNANGIQVNIGYHPASTYPLAGDSTPVVLEAPQAGAVNVFKASFLTTPVTQNTANFCEFECMSLASLTGAFGSSQWTNLVNAPIELATSAGTGNLTNTTGSNVTLQYEVIYWVMNAPSFT